MTRQLLTIILIILTTILSAQRNPDERLILDEKSFNKFVILIGNVDDSILGFEPGAGTSIVLLDVFDSDSAQFIGQKIIIIVPGQFTKKIKHGHKFRMTVSSNNLASLRDMIWQKYSDKNYKKMYLLDDYKALSEISH